MTTTALATLPAAPASAQTVWQGATSDWFTAGNWSNGVPGAADTAIINTAPSGSVINGGSAAFADAVFIGDGALNIANGSLDASSMTIGVDPGNVGTLSIGAGGSLNTTGGLTVGSAGMGTLNITTGGAVKAGANISIGDLSTGVGIVTVDGLGASLTADNLLYVGNSGQGTLHVTNGGVVTSSSAVIGRMAGSQGEVLIDGVGSKWINTGSYFIVGSKGTASLTIQNGGIVNANDGFALGDSTGSGIVTVTGTGSQLNVVGSLEDGNGGSGTLIVSNGGAVTSGHVTFGASSLGISLATVTGSGSVWTVTGDMVIGHLTGVSTLTIADTGIVNVGGILKLTDVSSTGFGTLNIGNGGAAGTLNVTSIESGIGTATINFNHTDTNYVFAPGISGNGTIYHIAGNTTLTGDSSGFTGTTYVTGGRLSVAGLLGGTVDVGSGGALGGNGTISALVANSGGIVAPGNSIGTLNVGAMTFNAGSIYTVELNDGGNVAGINNDHISAGGAVTINGGTVHVTPENGTDTGKTYTVGTKYTVITAAGGVTGSFGAVMDDFAFLNFNLSYDANNVFLTSQLAATSFCLPGMSANQCAAGNGAFSVGSGQLFDALLNLSAAQAPGALDQLSGEVHASAKTMLIDDSRFVRDAALNRLRASSGGVGAANAPVSVMDAYGAYTKVAPTTEHFAVWGHGFGSWGQWNGNGNAAGLDRGTGGFIVGVDQTAFDNWRIGAFGGYSTTRFNVDARNSSGTSDNYHIGLYGGTNWGSLALRSGFAYAWHDLKTTRNVAFPGFSDTLKAGYEAGTAQAFGELAYGFRQASVAFEPFANLAYVNLRTDGFTEKGGAAALHSANSVVDTAFTTLGLRASTTFAANATARGSLGWRHAYGDTLPAAALAFAGGSPFAITGVAIAQDAAVLDLGLDFNLRSNVVFGVAYGGQFGSSLIDQTVRANLSARF